MTPSIGILSSACYLPPATKAATDVLSQEKISDIPLAAGVDFYNDLGIDQVHYAEEESSSDLGIQAARMALEKAKISPEQLSLVVDFTSIPEEYIAPTWGAGGCVQEVLGANNARAISLNTGGCTSYHIGLKYAIAQLLTQPEWEYALLFSGDKTPTLNKTYYPISITCDNGSAVILKKGHDRQVILSVDVATVGELHDVWYVPGIGAKGPDEEASEEFLHMRSDVNRFNEGVIKINLFMFRRVMRNALKRLGLKMRDIDYFIYPSFSTWDQDSFCSGFGLDRERVYTEGLARHGHLFENDMTLNYLDAVAEGKIKEGDLVMMTTNGSGFYWGAAIVRH